MVREIIENIKETEARAAGIIDDARKKKTEIIASAREDGKKDVEDARSQGVETVKQALAKAQQDAEVKMEEIAKREQADRETLKQAASKNISQAVDLVIERVVK
jgi:vacuolar-type H+-ATPase subunit H